MKTDVKRIFAWYLQDEPNEIWLWNENLQTTEIEWVCLRAEIHLKVKI